MTMTDRIWLKSYPEGVPADIDVAQFDSLVALIDDSFTRYRQPHRVQLHGPRHQLQAGRQPEHGVWRLPAGPGTGQG